MNSPYATRGTPPLDIAPCEGHSAIFDSVHWGDHQGARRFCVDPQTDAPRCEFYAACLRMTAAEQAGELGAHCVEGTRAGSLYIGGQRVTKPRATGQSAAVRDGMWRYES